VTAAAVEQTANSLEREAMAELAKELASELGISNQADAVESIVSKVRWYPNKAGAVLIVRRGKDRKLLATISPNKGKWTHLYPTWERVLTQLAKEKAAAGVSRLSHDGLATGAIPEREQE